ncbi:MAG: carboxypeptidase regulatory-like domain-containing protein [Deltaproteobacteria bacterium]|nr:carboxypeptidase regulatory-like domain-containing protein [Deltaproteobacteria bacterium]
MTIGGCGTEVATRDNPFDPQSTNPAPGALIGLVEVPDRADASGLTLELAGEEAVAPATTDASGAFLFAALNPGRYNLTLEETGYQPVQVFGIEIPAGETVDLGRLILTTTTETSPSGIQGVVLLEGAIGGDHSGSHVRVIGRSYDTFSAPDGSFSLVVPEGTHDLELSHRDHVTQQLFGVVVAAGTLVTLAEPVLLPVNPASVTGNVSALTCTVDPADAVAVAAEGALVSVQGTGVTAVVAPDGAFTLTGVPPGSHTLHFGLAGHEPASTTVLDLHGGQAATLPETVVLTPSRGTVDGTILLTGQPEHAGTVVQLTGTGFVSITGTDGGFRIGEVCAGQGYELRAVPTRSGFLPAVVGGIEVLAGQRTTLPTQTLAPQSGDLNLGNGSGLTNDPTRVVPYTLQAATGTTEMRMSEDLSLFTDAARAAEGWGPYAQSGTFTLSAGEGRKWVYAQVRDAAGAVSGRLEATILLDLTAPTNPAILIEDGGIYSNDGDGALLLTLTASEAPDLAAGVDEVSGLALLRLLNHDLQSAGTPPSDPADPAWAAVTPIAYSRIVDHPLLRPSTDEAKEVWVRFSDRAGNWSLPISASVILDRQAPSGTTLAITGSAPGWAKSERVTLNLTATDANPGLQMRLAHDSGFAGAVTTPFAPTVAWNLLPGDGSKEVWVTFVDAAGNAAQALSASIQLDTLAPTGVSVSIAQAPYSPTRDLTLGLAQAGATQMVVSLKADFTDGAGQPLAWLPVAPTASIQLPDLDGEHAVHAKFRDAADNVSIAPAATVVLDQLTPDAPLLSVEGGPWVASPAITATIVAVGRPIDAHEMRVDLVDQVSGSTTTGTWRPYALLLGLSPPGADGGKQVVARVRDAAGHVSPPATVDLVLDTSPPSLSVFEIEGGAAAVRSPFVTLTATAAGAYQMRVSDRADFAGSVWQSYAPTLPWRLPASDGTHTVFVEVRDEAGHVAGASDDILLDTTPPGALTLTLADGQTWDTDGQVKVAVSAVDSGSGLAQLWLDHDSSFSNATVVSWLPAGAPSLVVDPWALLPGDGQRAVHVRVIDAVGNRSDAARSIAVDATPPEGKVVIDNGATWSTDTTLTLSLNTGDAVDMAVVESGTAPDCSVGGLPWEFVTFTKTWPTTATQGLHTIWVCFRDAAGNTFRVFDDILLDTTPPTGTIRIDADATWATSTQVVLGLTAPPDTTHMALANAASLACGTVVWEPFAPNKSWTLPAGDGPATVSVCFKDAAGNVAGSFSDGILLDTTPPQTPTLLIENGATWTNAPAPGHTVQISPSAVGATWVRIATDGILDTEPLEALAGPFSRSLPTGDGPKTVWAIFEDDAGNQSVAVSDTILLDTAAPTGSVVVNQDAPYTSSLVVNLTLTMTEPHEMRIWTDGTEDEPWVPVATTTLANLPPGDGTATVRARFRDAAGNESGVYQDTIIVDTVPPSAPQVITADTVVPLPDNSVFTVQTFGPVLEANFDRYEILGGKLSSWTALAGGQSTTSFDFNLLASPSAETGVPNLLRIRARDLAGNVGPEGSVIVTTDINLPNAATANLAWVVNGNGSVTLHWQPGNSPDVVGYNVYYGPASGTLTGQYAHQGPSPVRVGVTDRALLSGLVNGTQLFATVRPVDHAGNEGPVPIIAGEVRGQPSEHPINLVGDVTTGMERISNTIVEDDLVYLAGTKSTDTMLEVYDLGSLASPLQGGVIQAAPALPVQTATFTYADNLDFRSYYTTGPSISLDGPYLFLASGPYLRIYRLSQPEAPALLTTLDFSPRILHDVVAEGERAFLSVRTDVTTEKAALVALDLGKLYDLNPATVPSPLDVIGESVAAGGWRPSSLAWTRDKIVQFNSSSGSFLTYDVADALDDDVLTVFDDADYIGGAVGRSSPMPGGAVVSGNRLYLTNTQDFEVYPLESVWSGSALNGGSAIHVTGVVSQGQLALAGGQVFFPSSPDNGIRVLDLVDFPAGREVSRYLFTGYQPTGVTLAGNYGLVARWGGLLTVVELGVPRQPHELTSALGGGSTHEVRGGFVYGGSGNTVDLQSGWPPVVDNSEGNCSYNAAFYDDMVIRTTSGSPVIAHRDKVIDRDPSTIFNAAFDRYGLDVTDGGLRPGVKALGVAAHGNYLLVASQWSDGIYLDVFLGSPLRDRIQATELDMSYLIETYKLTDWTSADAWVELSVHRGRLFVSLDAYNFVNAPATGLYIIDLAPALDDDPATSIGASQIQGAVGISRVRTVDVSGGTAYVATGVGLEIVDVSAALDASLATLVPANPTTLTLGSTGVFSVVVHGSYLFSLGRSGWPLAFHDVSDPSAPLGMGTVPVTQKATNCGLPGGLTRGSLSVHGSTLYSSASGSIQLFALE